MKKSVLIFASVVAVIAIVFSFLSRPRLRRMYQSEIISVARLKVAHAGKQMEAGFRVRNLPFDSSRPAYLEFSDPPQIEVLVGERGPYAQFTFDHGVLHVDDGAGSPWFDVKYVSKDRLEADGLVFVKAK